MVRKAGRTRSRTNSVSHSATPRMSGMPSTAARRPMVAAMTRSWTPTAIRSGATTPMSAGASACATKKPISAAAATGARLFGELEQLPRLFEYWRVQAFSEPVVDRRYQISGFCDFALVPP